MHPDYAAHENADTEHMAPEAKIAELERQLREAREEQLRLLAEMDNQRKRAAKDVEASRKYGAERLLGDLLPVCDSLEAGLKIDMGDPNKIKEGLVLTLQLIVKALQANGLVELNPQGQDFDPEKHQAMAMVESADLKPGTVVSVLQKGYLLNDRLLRPALVTVAKAKSAEVSET